MPLALYRDIYASGSVPQGCTPVRGSALKYTVRNRAVLRELRRLHVGKWKKVIKQGNFGEVHYFEHESGSVAGVKFFSGTGKP
ncbi:MAG: hypothetical protein BA872_02930 [Desulfobacterales bacterium C00003060]|nr:MAG: hypothetical protein BA861_05225 [Desulfobacterales bacterium S3730MH5]OEU79946.1 MAG: hypothetical protein BA872_02930 [Desulfobacterales bacterium C00003060]OEU82037.1 MAG: hypothetical protein BA865_06365 [Desulfobacterales bacterium S5133MH4]